MGRPENRINKTKLRSLNYCALQQIWWFRNTARVSFRFKMNLEWWFDLFLICIDAIYPVDRNGGNQIFFNLVYQTWLGCYRSHNTGSLYVCQSNLTKDITNRRQRYMPKTCLCYKSQFKIVGGLKVLNL